MLHMIQYPVQFANPYVIEALTKCHGVYVNVYNKEPETVYDEGRDSYISNAHKFNKPLYKLTKLLFVDPVQWTYSSGEESFDNYMKTPYILTCDKKLTFEEKQKFEIFYDRKPKAGDKPQRVMQCFEVKEYSNSYNKCSIRQILLQPFA